ncbi:MAG TPA: crossover junction endodeoxyribonuclease RuvC, partial [Petrotogaceae bacterium]|nr:crossover junction endodeoxyribonuclease RuvC [Petrotogaceae bacterium]
MRILGIDPGYGKIGVGILDKKGNSFSLVDYGVILTDKDKSLSKRLLDIDIKVAEVIQS